VDNVTLTMPIATVSSSTGIGNDRGRHLYVFQDSEGLIKIGRSGDPKARRRSLEFSSGRKISIVLTVRDRGANEKAIMTAAARYRGIGEWFENCAECRLIIEREIGRPIKWPRPSQLRAPDQGIDASRQETEDAIAALCAEMKLKPRRPRKSDTRDGSPYATLPA
jgi:hypothetical protein